MSKQKYSESGGLNWGANSVTASYVTFPFASFEVSEDGVLLSVNVFEMFKRSYFLTRSEISNIQIKKILLGCGFRVNHSNASLPSYLLFSTFGSSSLELSLKNCGYSAER